MSKKKLTMENVYSFILLQYLLHENMKNVIIRMIALITIYLSNGKLEIS
jgi:hypothetical protein